MSHSPIKPQWMPRSDPGIFWVAGRSHLLEVTWPLTENYFSYLTKIWLLSIFLTFLNRYLPQRFKFGCFINSTFLLVRNACISRETWGLGAIENRSNFADVRTSAKFDRFLTFPPPVLAYVGLSQAKINSSVCIWQNPSPLLRTTFMYDPWVFSHISKSSPGLILLRVLNRFLRIWASTNHFQITKYIDWRNVYWTYWWGFLRSITIKRFFVFSSCPALLAKLV